MYACLASFRRAFFVAVVPAAVACSAGATYVTVPMSQTAPPADAGLDESADAQPPRVAAFRPLPVEPLPPERGRGCRREVACRTEEDLAATLTFPPPFERCPTHVPSNATFSVHETREARKDDPHACCYVGFLGCR
jgi:hypothetical protein